MTFPAFFARMGLRRGSKSYRDYEMGKAALAASFSDDYERGIRALAEYLCL